MRKLLVLILISQSSFMFSQNINFIPRISIGYNIGAGIDVGADLGVTFLNFSAGSNTCAAGADVSLDIFHGSSFVSADKASWYRLFCLSAMATANSNSQLKIGFGKTWTRWGLDDRNKSKNIGWGLSVDAGYAPWDNIYFGFHHCRVNTHCIGLAMKNSNILYSSYAFPMQVPQQGKGEEK